MPLFVTSNIRNTIFSASRKLKGFYIITSLFQTSHFAYYFHFHLSYPFPPLFIQQNSKRPKYQKAEGGKKSTFLHERTEHLPFRETVVKKRGKTVNASMSLHDYLVILVSFGNYFRRNHSKLIGIF